MINKRRFSFLVLLFSFSVLVFSCNGTTSVPGLEKNRTTKKHYPKKHKKTTTYQSKAGVQKRVPPGQHKKIHGDKSAKKYAPGQKKGKGHKKHNSHGKRH